MAADVLAHAQRVAGAREKPRRVEATGGSERRLRLAQPVGKRGDERQRQPQLGFDPRRLDGHRFERSLAADSARGRRVEAALEARRVELGRVDLHLVRGEILGQSCFVRPQTLGDAETKRELLVVARRPHGDGNRSPADPDLERFLDGHLVALGRAGGKPEDIDTGCRVRRRVHSAERTPLLA